MALFKNGNEFIRALCPRCGYDASGFRKSMRREKCKYCNIKMVEVPEYTEFWKTRSDPETPPDRDARIAKKEELRKTNPVIAKHYEKYSWDARVNIESGRVIPKPKPTPKCPICGSEKLSKNPDLATIHTGRTFLCRDCGARF